MKRFSSPFLLSGKKGKTKKGRTQAMKKMRQAKRKAARKTGGCEFC